MSTLTRLLQVSIRRNSPRISTEHLGRRLVQALAIAGFLGIWWLVAELGEFPSYLLPTPIEAGAAFLEALTSGELAGNLVRSVRHYSLGLAVGMSAGTMAGIATARYRPLELVLGPIIAMLRPIPPLAWIPFAIIWFHITTTAAAFIIAIVSFWLTMYAAYGGVRGVDRGLLDVAHTLGINSNLELIRRVLIPAALPAILTGIHQSFGQGWMAVVAAELFGVRGIGFRMMEAGSLLAMDVVVAYMALLGLAHLATDSAFRMVESWLLRWR